MPLSARVPVPLALATGLCLGLSALPVRAGSPSPALAPAAGPAATAAATSRSSTPTLGEALHPSTSGQVALADHLRARGVVFYGAFWCQHCFHQKMLFGKEAGNRLPYVECAKDEAGAKTCDDAGVLAYPTWVMGDQRRVGLMTLQELATWTGYKGTTDFPSSPTGR